MVVTLRVYPTLSSGVNSVDHGITGFLSDFGRGRIFFDMGFGSC